MTETARSSRSPYGGQIPAVVALFLPQLDDMDALPFDDVDASQTIPFALTARARRTVAHAAQARTVGVETDAAQLHAVAVLHPGGDRLPLQVVEVSAVAVRLVTGVSKLARVWRYAVRSRRTRAVTCAGAATATLLDRCAGVLFRWGVASARVARCSDPTRFTRARPAKLRIRFPV